MAGKDVVDLQTMSENEAESFLRNSLTGEEFATYRADAFTAGNFPSGSLSQRYADLAPRVSLSSEKH